MIDDHFHLPDYHRLWFRFPADSTNDTDASRIPWGMHVRPQPLHEDSPRSPHRGSEKLAFNFVSMVEHAGLGSSPFARRY